MERGSAERVPPATSELTYENGKSNAPQRIAHRGFAGVAPENTLAAVRAACDVLDSDADGPAGMVEIDVVPAASGEPVAFHDLTLGRLTGVSGKRRRDLVWETPVETLRGLSILDSRESVATFAEILPTIPSNVGVNVELKHPGTGQPRRELAARERARGRERWADLTGRVVSTLADHDNSVLLSSSYEGALAAVRDAAPDLPLAYLFWDSIEAGLAVTERYDCEAVNPSLDMIYGTDLFDSNYIPTGPFAEIDLVERAHEAGRAVNVWTVTDPQEAAQLQAAGVDGVITDYPGVLDPALEVPATDTHPGVADALAPCEGPDAASGD